MRAQQLLASPTLDGDVIGDAAWQGVVPATGFRQVQPDDGQPATQETEVYIGFLDDALYIGVVAYDKQVDAITVTDSRRDASLDDTDSFQVIIDGLRDGQNGYVFGTNPAGLAYDGQVVREGSGGQLGSGAGGFNLNWDGSWDVVATISDIGWSAEMRIPFRTLRYGPGETQTWGINFQRNIRRNNEVAYWAPLSRQRNIHRVSDAGTIAGIVPPAQKNLKVTPYVLGKSSRGGNIVGTESEADFGFDIKYSITPSLTLDATYNTDFAQVEVDEQQVNLDRFSLFLPEKRPFFLENAGQFTVGNAEQVELFFSRRIGIADDGEQIPIDGGVRLSGKVGGSTNLGFLYMSSEAVMGVAPGNQFTVARVNQELPGRSAVGFLIVDRQGDGSYRVAADDDQNQTYAIDGRWGIGENLILSAWAAKTATPGLAGRDDAYALKADYDSATWAYRLSYTEVGGDFNPEVGFLSRSAYERIEAFVMRRIRPDDLWGLLEIRPHMSYQGYWDFDGFQETGYWHNDVHWAFRNGYELHTAVNVTRSGLTDPFEIVDGVIVQPGTYDHAEGQIVFYTNQAAPLSLSFQGIIGGRFGGDRLSLGPELKYRIGETFSSELSYIYNKFDLPVPGGQFDANLARLRLSYSFTPKILLQALVQYNELDDVLSTNLRFAWLQSANSGLYLVYNEIDEGGVGALPAGREIILKYSHIFDVFN
ncbi:MAG: carbohydrate binding family 9 domain-containing protein [Gammaproteobacteria bacterium]|nr:carbohydrate binding family 9 domain-containing protein [Gammaproteobacteria bacterium]MDH5241443.1 carbohydrate binding family 9 domain-containing protein [Gammaproteobacteria bacterium]MDH5260822.1 carbohydrate binding family 9 domain-containing protein [Gammaproteobacteria bacterium]MDH5584403.1 carbohydrate binding family 9 domain-containing protein [Gammaproteobacteria bacterium]